jgi:hypothetical protein
MKPVSSVCIGPGTDGTEISCGCRPSVEERVRLLRLTPKTIVGSRFGSLAVLVFGVAGMVLVVLQASAQTPRPSEEQMWRVVVLNNADFLLPASAIMDQALRETLTKEAPRSIEFFGETLDSFRHPGTIDDQLYALLRKKYEGAKVDLVMARSRASMEFVRRHGQELWPNVPVVFYNELPESWRARGGLPNSTGVLLDMNPAYTIELALRYTPRAQAVRRWRHVGLRRHLETADRASVGTTSALSFGDLARPPPGDEDSRDGQYAAAGLDRALHLGDARCRRQLEDQSAARSPGRRGVRGTGFRFLRHLHRGWNRRWRSRGFCGAGQGGGSARLAGPERERAETIPVETPMPPKCIVDARAMKRFRIDESLLPADCEVLFRDSSLRRDHPWYVAGALAALAVQALLIATLIIQRKRRRQAEHATRQQRVELAHSLRLATIGEMTAAISHDVNQPLTAILSNAEAAEMMLGDGDRSRDQLREILADIRRDNLRASEILRRIRSFVQKHDVQKQVIDLNELVSDTVRLVDTEAAHREVTIEAQPAPAPCLVNGDRIQLQQP